MVPPPPWLLLVPFCFSFTVFGINESKWRSLNLNDCYGGGVVKIWRKLGRATSVKKKDRKRNKTKQNNKKVQFSSISPLGYIYLQTSEAHQKELLQAFKKFRKDDDLIDFSSFKTRLEQLERNGLKRGTVRVLEKVEKDKRDEGEYRLLAETMQQFF